MARDSKLKRKRGDSAHISRDGKKRRDAVAKPDIDSDESGSISENSDKPDDVEMNGEEIDGSSGEFGDEEKESQELTRTRQDFKNVNKPPTRDELRNIKEASELYKSNTFKLAIDALLPNVRPKESRVKPLDEFLRLLYTSLISLPAISPSNPVEAARDLAKGGIVVPYVVPQPSEDTPWRVAFEQPSDIIIVGSWATKTGVKSPGSASWTVDVAVEMPAALFQEKDYLDGRFFNKRAYYLACLASGIQTDGNLHVECSYDFPSDARLTSLVLVPRNDGSATDFSKSNAQVRVLPVLPFSSPISLQHLSPTHSNLRIKTSDGNGELLKEPTPIYSTDLLMLASVRERLLRIHETFKDVPALRDALALLRVWANQRGYGPGVKQKGGVSGFEGNGYFWTAVMHAIVSGEDLSMQRKTKGGSRRLLGRGLSSYQLFRAALDFLAKHDFSSHPFFVKGGSRFSSDVYGNDAVFADTCSVNLLAGMPLVSLDLLRRDAKITLGVLDAGGSPSMKIDPFDEVFLRDRRQLSTRFDVALRVDLRRAHLRKSNLVKTLDHGSSTRMVLTTMSSILRRALGDRVHAIAILQPTNGLRPLSEGTSLPPLTRVHIGLILNVDNAFRLVDHGPAASEQDSAEAIEFRDFWGSMAELRRFKDGRIVESVVWEVNSLDARARIPAGIVSHVLQRHLGLDAGRDIHAIQKDIDDLLRVPDVFAQRLVFPGVQPGFKSAMTAFDNLVRDLKSLDEEIPLAVLNVSPVSSSLRYTSVFTPTPVPPKHASSLPSTMRYLPAMEIVIQYERSGRWPDDLAAIQKMKLAFFERIASALMTKVSGLMANVVTSHQQTLSSISDDSFLEIVTPDGWAFAARIWHEREGTLLERVTNTSKKGRTLANGAAARSADNSTPEGPDCQSALEAYELYARNYLHAPKHHRAIANLCHRFPAFAGTVRLVKRWLAAHWIFEGHVTGEAIELICAFVFIRGTQNAMQRIVDVPSTKELGFFRVLEFLKEWDWKTGLSVPLYEDVEEGEDDNAKAVVKAGSGTGVWTISTAEDRSGRVWAKDRPNGVAARRIKMLATASINYVLEHEWEEFIPKSLLLHSTEDYDFLIRLRPDVLCRTHQSLEAPQTTMKRYVNIPETRNDEPVRVGFDPVLMYFNDLKHIYQGTLAFFFDPYGGGVIGGVWDPSLFAARPFRVLANYSMTPIGDVDEDRKQNLKPSVVLNEASVLAEIQRLGEGLVQSIEVQRVP